MKKTKYYFTFGLNPRYPYLGGWVEVWAVSLYQAIAIFRERYPDRTKDVVNCADYYTQNQFAMTGMLQTGNLGAYCQEVLGEED